MAQASPETLAPWHTLRKSRGPLTRLEDSAPSPGRSKTRWERDYTTPMLAAFIAQSPTLTRTPTGQEQFQIWFWLGMIALAAVVIVVIAVFVRRRLLRNDDDPTSAVQPFSLGDLRKLRASGQMTEEEFQRARAGVLARSAAMLASDDKPAGLPTKRAHPEAMDTTSDDASDNEDSDNGQGPEARDERQ
jgi:hypothetical protein